MTNQLRQVTPNLYGYANVGRFGLGHSMMAWARCVVWCHQAKATMLAPHWFRLRIGPYLRRERDKRAYFLLFNNNGYASGVERLAGLLFWDKISAEERLPSADFLPTRKTIVLFCNAAANNDRRHFPELAGHSTLLNRELRRITKRKHIPEPFKQPIIGIHVRMGDFSKPKSIEEIKSGAHNSQIPVEWYCEMLIGVRKKLGANIPAIVFSDGEDEALKGLLTLPAVRRSPSQAAITDMLSISQTQLLISSASGFSGWGSYLGQVPRICFPGQLYVRVLDSQAMEIECEVAADIPADFMSRLEPVFLPCLGHR